MSSCIGETSADTEKVYNLLCNVPIGDTVAYKTIDLILGKSCPVWIRDSARNMALRDDRIVFGTRTNIGYKRLDDAEVVENTSSTFRKIQRNTERERMRLSSVNFESLQPAMKSKHSASAAILAVMYEMSKPKRVKKIEGMVEKSAYKLSMVQTLEAVQRLVS
jgi:hypothetical protein